MGNQFVFRSHDLNVGVKHISIVIEKENITSTQYEYRKINVSLEPPPDDHGIRKATIESVANRWAEKGWRTVAVMPSIGSGYADAILIERIVREKR